MHYVTSRLTAKQNNKKLYSVAGRIVFTRTKGRRIYETWILTLRAGLKGTSNNVSWNTSLQFSRPQTSKLSSNILNKVRSSRARLFTRAPTIQLYDVKYTASEILYKRSTSGILLCFFYAWKSRNAEIRQMNESKQQLLKKEGKRKM